MRRANGSAPGAPGGQRMMPSVDFYRRVPRDLTEATRLGAIMSICCIVTMSVLFLSETIAFARTQIVTSIAVDDKYDSPQIKLNFDILFLDLSCQYLSVDVLDSIGANRQNITKNVEKWNLDEQGRKKGFHGRNREQVEVRHEEHDEETIAEYDGEPGDHPFELDSEHYDAFLSEFNGAFINFYAPWCVWCQRLHPTWDQFAHQIHEENMKVGIAMVDCVAQRDLCQKAKVMAFPTLRWFDNGQPEVPDYRGDRTVNALVQYTKAKGSVANQKLEPKEKERQMKMKRARQERMADYGCQVTGHVMVNRVPGNFHVEAKSVNHNLNTAMTNLSHVVQSLWFGDEFYVGNEKRKPKINRILKMVPDKYLQFDQMDEKKFVTENFHEAYHHNMKVVATDFDLGSGYEKISTYQMLAQSQLAHYNDMNVPEARFSYDISPMKVLVSKQSRKWYDYLTSLCAIIGGTFTTLGLIDASLYRAFKSKKL